MKLGVSMSAPPPESNDSSDSGSCPESDEGNDKGTDMLETRRETADVRVWRLVVLAAMAGTATLVSTGLFLFLRKKEHDGFVESVSIWYLIDRI
jgi:hypothetical protein